MNSTASASKEWGILNLPPGGTFQSEGPSFDWTIIERTIEELYSILKEAMFRNMSNETSVG